MNDVNFRFTDNVELRRCRMSGVTDGILLENIRMPAGSRKTGCLPYTATGVRRKTIQ